MKRAKLGGMRCDSIILNSEHDETSDLPILSV